MKLLKLEYIVNINYKSPVCYGFSIKDHDYIMIEPEWYVIMFMLIHTFINGVGSKTLSK